MSPGDMRQMAHPPDVRTCGADALRAGFLIETLLVADAIKLSFIHIERMIVGVLMPVAAAIVLPVRGPVQFVGCTIGKVSIFDSINTIWFLYGSSIVVLLLVTNVPAISLWLPGVFR
jgi:TRAP-type C4-dicarboxylate transport system permease large subunit